MYRLPVVLVLINLCVATAAIGADRVAPENRMLAELAARQIRFLSTSATPANVRAQVEYFAAQGSRVPGYQGAEAAYRHVLAQFRGLKLRDVRTDTLHVGVPVDAVRGDIVVNGTMGRLLRAWCLWPNGVRTPTTKPGGIVGPLVDGGDGSWQALDGQQLNGSIVLMDFGSDDRWVRAASLGARAVVFAGGEEDPHQAAGKFLPIPADVPRFWVDGESAQLMRRRIAEERLKGTTPNVRVEARMDWQSVPAYNVYGWIPGMDEDMPAGTRARPQKWKDQTILLHAHYDATSVVPALAPGAESAASITALIEIARALAMHKPDYTLLFVATSGHFTARQGIKDFLHRHGPDAKDPADRIDFDLMLSLDLSSGQPGTMGIASGPDAGRMSPQSRRLARAVSQIFADSLRYVDDTAQSAPRLLADAVASQAGYNALSLVTVGGSSPWLDTPFDTPDRVNYENLATQIHTLTALVMWAAKDPLLLQSPGTHSPVKDRTAEGQIRKPMDGLLHPAAGVWVVNRPPGPASVGGVRTAAITTTDDYGHYHFASSEDGARITAYDVDPASGTVTSALDQSADTPALFESQSMLLLESEDTGVPIAVRSAIARHADGAGAPWGLDVFAGASGTGLSVIHAAPGSSVQLVLDAPPGGYGHVVRGLPIDGLNQPLDVSEPPAQHTPSGLAVRPGRMLQPGLVLAQDMWLYDTDQLRRWHALGMRDRALEMQQKQARQVLLEARGHVEAQRYSLYPTALKEAWQQQTAVHTRLESLRHGATVSLVLQLALLVPLACIRVVAGTAPGLRATLAGLGCAGVGVVIQWIHPARALMYEVSWTDPLLAGSAAAGVVLAVWLAARWPQDQRVSVASVVVLTGLLAVVQACTASGGLQWLLAAGAGLLAVVTATRWRPGQCEAGGRAALARAVGPVALAAVLSAVLGQLMLVALMQQGVVMFDSVTLATWPGAVAVGAVLLATGGIAAFVAGSALDVKIERPR